MLVVANGAPILARNVLRSRGRVAVDFGRRFRDGHRLLGRSKTWRGIAAAILVTALVAPLVGHGFLTGAAVGFLAMVGDLASSFVKRRLGLPSSAMALGIDQLPEALVPAATLSPVFRLDWIDVMAAAALFLVIELALSFVLYLLGIREHPY